MSALDDLIERVEALEQRAIGVNDLPIQQLQDRLEQDWSPSPDVLLPNNSISRSLLQQKLDFGSTLQNLLGTSGSFVVMHGLGEVPDSAVAVAYGPTANDMTTGTGDFTKTQFTVYWRRASGLAAPPACTFYWFAGVQS